MLRVCARSRRSTGAHDHPWYPGEAGYSTFERLTVTQAENYRRVVGVEPKTDEQKRWHLGSGVTVYFFHAMDAHQDLSGKGIADEDN